MSKEILIAHINAMSDADADKLYTIISTLTNWEVKRLSDTLGVSLESVDFARPQLWSDAMRELGVNPIGFVWSYQEKRISGAPMNLHNRLLEEIRKFLMTNF